MFHFVMWMTNIVHNWVYQLLHWFYPQSTKFSSKIYIDRYIESTECYMALKQLSM
jgi:hypothetical protein